ncbi:DUF2703 domain-containing protein [candidate division TA06 bacterium]|nr:DUF2703 domain-containing protein [candidate division TA06 bacterium]
MKIQIYYFDGCTSYEMALQQLKQVMKEEGIEEEVELIQVSTDEEVKQYRFLGSPTLHINGKDMDKEAFLRRDYQMKCRLYWTEIGHRAIPSEEMMREALRGAKK